MSDSLPPHQIRSVAQSCPTLCGPMNHSAPGLPVHHQLPEFTETHVHRVSDAIQPSHPLSSPSHHIDSSIPGSSVLQYLLVQFRRSVMSDSLRSHGLKHARLPCPSPTPGACSDSCFIKLVMPSNHLILCHPLLLLPSIFPSIRDLSIESVLCIRWPKYWSFSFSISPSNE